MNDNLKHYIENCYKNITGFQEIPTFLLLDHLDKFTEKKGGAMEIGIHHGQFYIGLNSLIPANFKSYAIDVFDQTLNIDNSGDGDLEKFLNNLNTYDHHKGENTIIIKGDSTDVSVFKNIEKCHYISVDGGHTPQHVLNDLKIVSTLVTDDGIVIVDDYFNHWWPSVTEGITYFLMTHPTLVPFATSKNKMWMCKITKKHKYYNHCLTAPTFNKTQTSFFNHNIVDLW